MVKLAFGFLIALGLAPWVFGATPAIAADPITIHIGTPDASIGGAPSGGINLTTVTVVRHLWEQEFAKDGIKVEWTFFKGAGPAINEALANKQLDFVYLGDLAHIIGKASGLDTRYLVPTRGSNAYLVTNPDAKINGIADLKGKRVAVFRGTAYQFTFDRALATAKLTERDMQVTNLDWNAAAAAIAAKQIDATWTNYTGFGLKEKGVATIPASSKTLGRNTTFQAGVAGRGEFIAQHPDLTERVVKVFVEAQAWLSDPAHLDEFYTTTSAVSGVPVSIGHAEYDGDDLKFRFSPRMDEFVTTGFQQDVNDAKALNLIRKPFEVKDWVDGHFVDQAIKDLNLDKTWPLYDKDGKPIAG